MPELFESRAMTLQELLDHIHSGVIQLPDFQRSWVWTDTQIRKLLTSISQGFPVGALMMLQTGGQHIRFKPRPIDGAPQSDTIPVKLILDGQQRSTSLYRALQSGKPVKTRDDRKKEIERIYFVDIAAALAGGDWEEVFISLPPERRLMENFNRDIKLDVSTPSQEYALGLLPVSLLMDAAGLDDWTSEHDDFWMSQDDFALFKEKRDQLKRFKREFVTKFREYRVPEIVLLRETPKQAVCQVFENVNTLGVPLTIFELMIASYAADDFDLRRDWEGEPKKGVEGRQQRLAKNHLLKRLVEDDFGRDFLQACTLLASYRVFLAGGGAVSCKRKDILDLPLSSYRACADDVERGLLVAARLLHREKVLEARNLPYPTQLVPLSVIAAVLGERLEEDAVRRKVAAWYWCGVFGELYGSSTETRFANDVREVVAWIDDDSATPRTVMDCNFAPRRLISLRSRNAAAYKGLMAQLLKAGSRDFRKGDTLEDTTFFQEKVDIHHIFPRHWCKQTDKPSERSESIINKTPLTAKTNQKLGGRAPSLYLQGLKHTPQRLVEILESHHIDLPLLRADDFEAFFIDRARRLLDIIEDATGRPIVGRDSEDVISSFGGPLARQEPPVVLFGRYRVESRLSGGMARCYRVRDLDDGQTRFLKHVPRNSFDAAALQRELDIYSRLSRAMVPGVLQVIECPRDDEHQALVTEYADGGDLAGAIQGKQLTAVEIKAVALPVLEALQQLHEVDVVHRDLKPGNILLHEGAWKLADFGIAKNRTDIGLGQRTFQRSGSPGFAAPEQMIGADAAPSADVFSFGKLLVYLLCGSTDFDRVKHLPGWPEIIGACLRDDPADRPSLEQVKAWLGEIDQPGLKLPRLDEGWQEIMTGLPTEWRPLARGLYEAGVVAPRDFSYDLLSADARVSHDQAVLAWKRGDQTIALIDGAAASEVERENLTLLAVREDAAVAQVADWLKQRL